MPWVTPRSRDARHRRFSFFLFLFSPRSTVTLKAQETAAFSLGIDGKFLEIHAYMLNLKRHGFRSLRCSCQWYY